MRLDSAPFLVPLPESVKAETWDVGINGEWFGLERELAEWDYATELRFRRRFHIDLERIRSDCRINDEDILSISVNWHASGTGQRGCLAKVAARDQAVLVTGKLPGQGLGGILRLNSRIVLGRRNRSPEPLSPVRAGSILWQDEVTTHLEGEAPMFPVEVVDFGAMGLPAEAAWYLDWGREDLEAAALGVLRLYLNRLHPYIKLMTGEGDIGEASALIQSAMRWDLLRQMVERAIDNPEFDQIDYPEGSLGAALNNAVSKVYPAETIASVRSRRQVMHSDYETRLQAVGQLFHD